MYIANSSSLFNECSAQKAKLGEKLWKSDSRENFTRLVYNSYTGAVS